MEKTKKSNTKVIVAICIIAAIILTTVFAAFWFWPSNITRQEARDIAYAHVGGGRVNEPSRDFARFQRAWSVEVFYDGFVHEVYINSRTGEIIKVEIEPSSRPTVGNNANNNPGNTNNNNNSNNSNDNNSNNNVNNENYNTNGNIEAPSNGNQAGNNQPPNNNQNNRPTNPAISRDRAIEIAYADLAERGINATFRASSGMSWERGQWVWELEFRTQGERMPIIEYYINVNNGNIAKFEWDD